MTKLTGFTVWTFKPSGKHYDTYRIESRMLSLHPDFADIDHVYDEAVRLISLKSILVNEGWSAVIHHSDGFAKMVTVEKVNEILKNRDNK